MLAVRAWRRPRAGGAVPVLTRSTEFWIVSSPRRRGCSRVRVHLSLRSAVVPAQAGLFRRPTAAEVLPRCRPRAGGAVPEYGPKTGMLWGSSPRRRGCSHDVGHRLGGPGVVPAQAGLFPPNWLGVYRPHGRPRAGGAVPWISHNPLSRSSSSPRRRGCSAEVRDLRTRFDVVPAQAGLFPTPRCRTPICLRRPRAGGAVPPIKSCVRLPAKSSPRRRGCSRRGDLTE